jgi:tellurium resistance protein TerD
MLNLYRNQTIDLAKSCPRLSAVRVSLRWDKAVIDNRFPDCDVSAFMLNAGGSLPDEGYLVFYNNLKSSDGSVRHNGDNRTGGTDEDCETIDINLSDVPGNISQICFTISINNTDCGFNFYNVKNAAVKVFDLHTGNILCAYALDESFPDADTLNMGRLFRDGDEWYFEALGDAYTGGLEAALSVMGAGNGNLSGQFSSTLQNELAEAICRAWPDAIVKKINKDNFLDIHMPSINKKSGTHLGLNTAKNKIKICFYCRDKDFIARAVEQSHDLEPYSQGVRPKGNPSYSDIGEAVSTVNKFLQSIKQSVND